MPELEDRLRDAARSESAAYEPSADLPVRIGQRVRSRRRRAQALAGGGALAVAALAAVLVTQLPGDDHQGVVTNEPSSTTTSTPVPTTSTTVPTTASTVPTTVTTLPPVLDSGTPLNPKGVGPIEAGMTVAEAESASGLSFTLEGSTEELGGCYYVQLEGQPDLAIRVNSPSGRPDAPFREGVIQAITIYDLDPDGASSRLTSGGVGLGAPETAVRRAHGAAVEELAHDYVPEGAYLYVHPDDVPGFGIRYVLDERRVVTSIDVGLAGAITAPEGCL